MKPNFYLVQHHHANNVTHDEGEGILGRHTKVLPVDGTVHVGIPGRIERKKECHCYFLHGTMLMKGCVYKNSGILLFFLLVLLQQLHLPFSHLLINLRNFSRHQRQQRQQQRIALAIVLSVFCRTLWSMYSKMTRIIRTMAMMSEPNASVPVWYLRTRFITVKETG